jgi:ferredoxin-NADP reductase
MQHGPGLHMGGMKKKLATFEVAFKGKRKVAEGTYEFTFEKPADIHFSAGQHVRMTLINPSETDAEGDKRFFTMASTPQEPDLKFAWRVRDTAFKRVMNAMQPGQKVIIQKLLGETPKGSFVLHDDASVPAVFIVGGIGIIPAYAMVKDAMQRGLSHKMYLFYSNRRPEDAPYLAELQSFAKQNSNFKLIATMTEPEKSAQKWEGETGFTDRGMLEKYVPDLHAPIYYVSGLTEMVNAMLAVLAEAGVGRDSIRAEEFAGFQMGEGMNHGEQMRGGGSQKNHLLISAVILVVLGMVVLHVSGGISLSHSDLQNAFSFKNPISYLVAGLVLAVIAFKVFVGFKLKNALRSKQPGEKISAKDIMQAHKPAKKG